MATNVHFASSFLTEFIQTRHLRRHSSHCLSGLSTRHHAYLYLVTATATVKPPYNSQIQTAAQSASDFIAIITPDSKDREWIFFEAGAAWGRNQLYTPLLVNTSPSDLGSSIAGYQAIHANDLQGMEQLVENMAQAVGGTAE